MIALSRAERLALAGAAILIALALAASLAPWLEYRRELLAAQPWRAVTGHLVHLSWLHAAVNATAWLVLARLFAHELGARWQLALVLLAALGISGLLACGYPQIGWYRGFSGVLHALYFAGAIQATAAAWRAGRLWRGLGLPAALLALGGLKVALELPADGMAPYSAWLGAPVVPQAHLLGALCGTALGLMRSALAPAQPRGEGEQRERE
ncbi:MAG: rhombosortase [Sutterellaceae bacterium]|nr:rhombosortase [Burkholderiaceae bacterium]MDW8429197.1 rhombosortase [Sutterellaceae bacterium]